MLAGKLRIHVLKKNKTEIQKKVKNSFIRTHIHIYWQVKKNTKRGAKRNIIIVKSNDLLYIVLSITVNNIHSYFWLK